MVRDWHDWYGGYDDPESSLSRRLSTVRGQLAALLDTEGPVRLLSLCSGDGRDTLPVLEAADVSVSAVLVELDPVLAETARRGPVPVEVRVTDAGTTDCAVDAVPADVVMACGIFGNITDGDIERTVATLPSLLVPGGHVVWTRGRSTPQDPSTYDGDPSELVRSLFAAAGFTEVAFVRPDDASFRVGVHRWPGPAVSFEPGVRMFSFV